jgi:hypothetical protein
MADLGTTNILLGIMAAVSILEGLLIIGLGVGGFIAYRRVMALVTDLEARHIVPLTNRVNGILDDVKAITARVEQQAARVDSAIAGTMDRVDHTADRVKHSVWTQVDRVTGLVRGVRAAVASVLSSNGRPPTEPVNGPYPGTPTAAGY